MLEAAKNTGDFGRHHDYEQAIMWPEHDYFSAKLQAAGTADEDYWLCTIYNPNMILIVRIRSGDEEVITVAKIEGNYIA